MSPPPRPHTLRWLKQELAAWEQEGLISPQSASTLRTRYLSSTSATRQLAPVLVSVFGTGLIGAGIIALFAYNWDQLGYTARTVLSFTPLLLTQILAFFALTRWSDSSVARESVCAGLFCAIGASIALIAQTYQIGGSFAQFMLIWYALTLPAVYLLRSGAGFWLCQCALIAWGSYAYWYSPEIARYYPLLFAATLPYYFWIRNHSAHGPQKVLNKWAIALAAPIGLSLWLESLTADTGPFIFAIYFATCLCLDQNRPLLRGRPFALVAIVSLAVLLLSMSAGNLWNFDTPFTNGWPAGLSLPFILAWIAGVTHCIRKRSYWLLPISLTPLVILLCQYFLTASPNSTSSSSNAPASLVLTAYTLIVGIGIIISAIRMQRLLALNLGLCLLSALAFIKFFDANFSLTIKGIAFIITGSLFLATNRIVARKLKEGPSHA